ncbi:MAG TPA: ribonuclease III [Ruminiclostridium sp.]|nr:ribonuclease III [Ruminiclostridium sp.]
MNIAEFENKIGYTFKNKQLLMTALTHSSFANEAKGRHFENNERLEFLGDAVLGIITAEYLFFHNSHVPEGELTRLRAMMVCEKSLHKFALQIELGKYLRLGHGEENTGGRERPSILADAFEAVTAAIYIDGGMEAAKRHITHFADQFFSSHISPKLKDYKTALQEIVQKNRSERLEYVLAEEKGPDHDKEFIVEVHLNSNVIGTGHGGSKKEAEQMAAKEALALMGQ